MDQKEEREVLRLINELSKVLPGYLPLEYIVKTTEGTQKLGLAKSYADKGFRDYLLRQIQQQYSANNDVDTTQGLWVQKARVGVLKELLRASKTAFDEAQLIDKTLKVHTELA